jgi:hypothetical protein
MESKCSAVSIKNGQICTKPDASTSHSSFYCANWEDATERIGVSKASLSVAVWRKLRLKRPSPLGKSAQLSKPSFGQTGRFEPEEASGAGRLGFSRPIALLDLN